MQNLNQIRARDVLAFANDPKIQIKGAHGGEVIKKIPPVILNNGLLSALAYSMDEKQAAWETVFSGIAKHLASPEIKMVPADEVYDAQTLLDYLVNGETDSRKLREVTTEAMAWLDFARRLVQ